ncbi:hypothetical protein ASD42_15315 [Nocardia sp. Root136]|uniref:hypothetical protein n=1 Tax=Nocardia sp. Root136 TaxID=1736458 RepID=UPI0006FCDBC3|nr:hypothetical protein [Nocardia sp. Root136]KQY33245.1 hypothetical protein ASD42_15315 [Nocardia sp. Root136]
MAEQTTDPDVDFALGTADPPVADVAEQMSALSYRIGLELAELGPPGWSRLTASFALTVTAESAVVLFADERGRAVRAFPAEDVLALVREHRGLSAHRDDEPWWRYLLELTADGRMEVDYDYGADPFPEGQLFAAPAYRSDLEVYPRPTLPVWLAAYIGHGGRQVRSPRNAAEQARRDNALGKQAIRSEPDQDFPAFPLIARRWAVLAAAFVAAGSPMGPRISPGICQFEGAQRSGATLCALPGGRAVLSGGVWNAQRLREAYQGGAPLPELFAGAPSWVAEPVLNGRASDGLLSFCYWWDEGAWHRGESPVSDELAPAVPAIWTSQTVVDVVADVIGATGDRLDLVVQLVAAAEKGEVTRAALAELFGEDAGFDIDSALFELTMAGATGKDTSR